jgi:hypothetical protein
MLLPSIIVSAGQIYWKKHPSLLSAKSGHSFKNILQKVSLTFYLICSTFKLRQTSLSAILIIDRHN